MPAPAIQQSAATSQSSGDGDGVVGSGDGDGVVLLVPIPVTLSKVHLQQYGQSGAFQALKLPS